MVLCFTFTRNFIIVVSHFLFFGKRRTSTRRGCVKVDSITLFILSLSKRVSRQTPIPLLFPITMFIHPLYYSFSSPDTSINVDTSVLYFKNSHILSSIFMGNFLFLQKLTIHVLLINLVQSMEIRISRPKSEISNTT